MDVTLVSTLALMSLVGFTLGIFGGGGSILAVPVLVYVAGVTPGSAIGISLAVVGATSLVGSFAHHRRGQVDPRVALLFGGTGMATAYLGARLTHLVSGRVLMFMFALMMMGVGAWMLFDQRRAMAAVDADRPSRRRLVPALLAGAAVGLVTGFLGVGGGFLVVPALIAFAGLEMRKAVGTSLLVIAINSSAGFLGHLSRGPLDFRLVALLTGLAIVGAIVGERAARRVSVLKLRASFAVFVITVGIAVAVSNELQAKAARADRPAAHVVAVT